MSYIIENFKIGDFVRLVVDFDLIKSGVGTITTIGDNAVEIKLDLTQEEIDAFEKDIYVDQVVVPLKEIRAIYRTAKKPEPKITTK